MPWASIDIEHSPRSRGHLFGKKGTQGVPYYHIPTMGIKKQQETINFEN